jgi:hypothetical protein
VKRIHIGEEEVPVPLAVLVPWGSSDDEDPVVVVLPEEEEVVPVPVAVQAPWGRSEDEEPIVMVPSEEDEVVLLLAVQAAWGSSDDDEGPIILFPKVKRWFKCLICLKDWYEHKDNVLFHIKNFINLEMGLPNMVEQHHQLSRLLEADELDL